MTCSTGKSSENRMHAAAVPKKDRAFGRAERRYVCFSGPKQDPSWDALREEPDTARWNIPFALAKRVYSTL